MKTFKIGKDLEIVCQSESTRYGFRHLATLLGNGREINKAKCCYYNRTWESFEFESVIRKLLSKEYGQEKNSIAKIERILNKISGKSKEDTDAQFKTIVQIATSGEVFGQNQKEKNDWKTRMLKAGLENQGLIMPKDWDTLDENTKEARLNAVIKQLNK